MQITIPFISVTQVCGEPAVISVEQITDISQRAEGGCYINVTAGHFVECRENINEIFPEEMPEVVN